jgi:uncharacterized membrane protein required for colicin V production
MTIFFDIIVLAFVLYFAYLGWEKGMWTAGVAALEVLACVSLAVILHEPVAGFLHSWLLAVSSDLSQTWAIFITFAILAWVPLLLLRIKFHTDDVVNLSYVEIDPLSDRVGGVIAGGIGGALFVGGILVTASMVPFLAPLKPSGDRMIFDPGKFVLHAAGRLVTERPEGHEGPPVAIEGGPLSSKTDRRAILTCEPWFDVNEDGEFSEETDRYRDADGDGSYSKAIYAADVDRTGKRRVGLIDKYVAACWDERLLMPVQKRTDITPPNTKKGQKGKKGDAPEDEEQPIKTDF